jgi:hypothetical protein
VDYEGSRAPCYTYRFVERSHRVEVTHWLDPKTGRTPRTERIETDARTGKLTSRGIERDFQYDVELPKDVFDLPGKSRCELRRSKAFRT